MTLPRAQAVYTIKLPQHADNEKFEEFMTKKVFPSFRKTPTRFGRLTGLRLGRGYKVDVSSIPPGTQIGGADLDTIPGVQHTTNDYLLIVEADGDPSGMVGLHLTEQPTHSGTILGEIESFDTDLVVSFVGEYRDVDSWTAEEPAGV